MVKENHPLSIVLSVAVIFVAFCPKGALTGGVPKAARKEHLSYLLGGEADVCRHPWKMGNDHPMQV